MAISRTRPLELSSLDDEPVVDDEKIDEVERFSSSVVVALVVATVIGEGRAGDCDDDLLTCSNTSS